MLGPRFPGRKDLGLGCSPAGASNMEQRQPLAAASSATCTEGSWGVPGMWANQANPSECSKRRPLIDKSTSRQRRSVDRRWAMSLRPLIESREDRFVRSTIMRNTTAAPTGGDWDKPGNWVGGVVPTASDNAVINLTGSGTITHSTDASDAALSLTTNGNTALSIGSGSIAIGSGSSSLGSVTISAGASLSVGSGPTSPGLPPTWAGRTPNRSPTAATLHASATPHRTAARN